MNLAVFVKMIIQAIKEYVMKQKKQGSVNLKNM